MMDFRAVMRGSCCPSLLSQEDGGVFGHLELLEFWAAHGPSGVGALAKRARG
jgi:hypothetical protein